MSWSPLPDAPQVELGFRGKARILVDESLGSGVAKFLREQGCNVVYACDVGLTGKSDEEIAAYASRENRMIWTHDRDFLDDKVLPEHRNPGVAQMWKKSKTVVTADGELTIRNRDPSSRTTSSRYRLTKNGVDVWSDS